jgi:hypothetical protein
MTADEWRAAIQADHVRPRTVRAFTFLKSWQSASRPAALSCDDGATYVAKGSQNQRMCFNDHVVGRLGVLLDAPVAEVVFVDVTDLVRIEPQMSHFAPDALAHGTRELRDCGERLTFEYAHVAENRSRFGALCVLYSWAGSNDHQMIYENGGIHLVHSVDHGHFFPNGPNWTAAALQAAAPAVLDPAFGSCGLVEAEMAQSKQRLREVTELQIASVVASPPDVWGVTMAERVVMADYLHKRQIQLVGTP